MEKITEIRPGDHVYTCQILNQQDYDRIGQIFADAGFEGEWPKEKFYFDDDPAWIFGVVQSSENWHGHRGCPDWGDGRTLTPEQVLEYGERMKAESETQDRDVLKKGADAMFALYSAYVDAGFNEGQALYLVCQDLNRIQSSI